MHATCVATIQHPKAPRINTITPPLPPPASHARLFTRQAASAFNQPLSFNTSKVTDMYQMFNVRSARALPPHSLESGPPHARHLRRHQAASAFNQPLSFDTSKVTTMIYMFNVRSARALRPPQP